MPYFRSRFTLKMEAEGSFETLVTTLRGGMYQKTVGSLFSALRSSDTMHWVMALQFSSRARRNCSKFVPVTVHSCPHWWLYKCLANLFHINVWRAWVKSTSGQRYLAMWKDVSFNRYNSRMLYIYSHFLFQSIHSGINDPAIKSKNI
jgi:hypothetical protein